MDKKNQENSLSLIRKEIENNIPHFEPDIEYHIREAKELIRERTCKVLKSLDKEGRILDNEVVNVCYDKFNQCMTVDVKLNIPQTLEFVAITINQETLS